MGHNSRTQKVLKSKIIFFYTFMVPDLAYKFQMIAKEELKLYQKKQTLLAP